MASQRRKVLRPQQVAVYHTYNRCAAQAFRLDPDGKDTRLIWVQDLMQLLTQVFAVEILFDAVMANHFHMILRTRPDIVARWSDEEVVRRWLTISKLKRNGASHLVEPTQAQIEAELQKSDRVAKLRKRLSHPSWFMGTFAENLSRRVNAADGTTGTIWEDRYQCTLLDTIVALILCALYVDLNPIRAGRAQAPEEAEYTSAFDRIVSFKMEQQIDRADANAVRRFEETRPDGWLAPLTLDDTKPADAPEFFRSATGRRPSDKGSLEGFSISHYVQLLDRTGRQLRGEPCGAIPDHLPPILDRLGIGENQLAEAVTRPTPVMVGHRLARRHRMDQIPTVCPTVV